MSSNDRTSKILAVALGVCLVCSVLVSISAVGLHARQERNKELDKIKNILIAGGLQTEGIDVFQVFQQRVKPVAVDLQSGRILSAEELPGGFDAVRFNIKEAADSREQGRALTPERDLIKMQRIPKVMPIYQITDDEGRRLLVLPIYGKGLWSTMYGFLALDEDLTTVRGLTFYEHGETPGLGGEVDNPNWKARWPGKKVFDETGHMLLQVIKGNVDPADPSAPYQVDGLSGATLTTRGLDAMIRFWLGDDGYGPFLRRMKEELQHES